MRRRGGPVRLAGEHDRVRLLVLAGELARCAKALRATAAKALMLPTPRPLDVIDQESLDVISDRDEQPAGSTTTLERHADGVTIAVPPLGCRGFLKEPGLIALGLLAALNAWIAVGSAAAVRRDGLVGVFTFEGSILVWPLVLFVTLMLTYELGRRAQLSARGNVLILRWTNLLRPRYRVWRRDELALVRVVSERSDSDAGVSWVQCLEILPRDLQASAPRYLLAWCKKAELQWIASTPRRSQRLPATQTKPKAATHGCGDEIA
jgi:hypothetical protein